MFGMPETCGAMGLGSACLTHSPDSSKTQVVGFSSAVVESYKVTLRSIIIWEDGKENSK